jgi:hypothetical protein
VSEEVDPLASAQRQRRHRRELGDQQGGAATAAHRQGEPLVDGGAGAGGIA